MSEYLITFAVCGFGALLFVARSPWLVDYMIWVSVLNRGVRRYVDWLAGAFNPVSMISLTPLFLGGLVFLSVFTRRREIPPRVFRIIYLLLCAMAYGLLVGLIRNKLAAVYTLTEYLVPISMLGFSALHARSPGVLDRWIRTCGWAAIVICAYGWYQYFTIPPWDAFWVEAVGLVGYLGELRPTEMVVFSTMSERGPFAGFVAWAVIPMIVTRRWRNPLGWFAIILLVSTLLLTFVRAALITVVLAAIVFPLINRGSGALRILLAGAAVFLALNFGLQKVPGKERIGERLVTLHDVANDGSFTGRIEIAQYGLGLALRSPIGAGLGSTGMASRVNSRAVESTAVIGDNGYLEVLLSFGWVGGFLFFYALYLAWKQNLLVERAGFRSEMTMTAKSLFIVGAILMYVGNWLRGSDSIVFWMVIGYALIPTLSVPKPTRPVGETTPELFPPSTAPA